MGTEGWVGVSASYHIVEQEMSTGQSAVMRCGWGSKTEWLIPFVA